MTEEAKASRREDRADVASFGERVRGVYVDLTDAEDGWGALAWFARLTDYHEDSVARWAAGEIRPPTDAAEKLRELEQAALDGRTVPEAEKAVRPNRRKTRRNRRIRQEYGEPGVGPSIRDLAERYGVTHSRIWQIIHGRSR